MTYLYHGTTHDKLIDISSQGLRPRKRSDSWNFVESRGRTGLFLSDTEDEATKWAYRVAAEDELRGEPVVLRFDRARVTTGIFNDKVAAGIGNWVASETIFPQHIEMRMGNRWVPIREAMARR